MGLTAKFDKTVAARILHKPHDFHNIFKGILNTRIVLVSFPLVLIYITLLYNCHPLPFQSNSFCAISLGWKTAHAHTLLATATPIASQIPSFICTLSPV